MEKYLGRRRTPSASSFRKTTNQQQQQQQQGEASGVLSLDSPTDDCFTYSQSSLSLAPQRQLSQSFKPKTTTANSSCGTLTPSSSFNISPVPGKDLLEEHHDHHHSSSKGRNNSTSKEREQMQSKSEPIFYSPSPVRQLIMSRSGASNVPPVRVNFGGPLSCEVDVLSPAHFDSGSKSGQNIGATILLDQMKDSYSKERQQRKEQQQQQKGNSSSSPAAGGVFVKLTRQQQLQRRKLQQQEKHNLEKMRSAEEQRLLGANRDAEWEERRRLINAHLYDDFGPQAHVFKKMFLEDDRKKRQATLDATIADRRRDNILVGRVPPPASQPPIPREVYEKNRFVKKTTVMDAESGEVREQEAEDPVLEMDEVEEIERAQFERTGCSPMFRNKLEYMSSVRRHCGGGSSSRRPPTAETGRSSEKPKGQEQQEEKECPKNSSGATPPPPPPPPELTTEQENKNAQLPPLFRVFETPKAAATGMIDVDSLEVCSSDDGEHNQQQRKHSNDDDDDDGDASLEGDKDSEEEDEIARSGKHVSKKLPETYCQHVGQLLREIRLSRPDIQRRQLARTMQQRGCEMNNKRRLEAEARFEKQQHGTGAGAGGVAHMPELSGTGWNSTNIDRSDPAYSATAKFIFDRRSRKTIQEQALDDLAAISSNSYIDEVTDKNIFFNNLLLSEKRSKFTYDEIAASNMSGSSPARVRRSSQQHDGTSGDGSGFREQTRPLMLNSHELRKKKSENNFSNHHVLPTISSSKKASSDGEDRKNVDHHDDEFHIKRRRIVPVSSEIVLGGKSFIFDEGMRC